MSEDVELEELRERTEKGSRVAAAAEQSESDSVTVRGTATVTLRDEFVAEFCRNVETNEDLQDELASELHEALDEDGDPSTDRSELLSQAVRVGLQEAAPDVAEDL